VVAFGVTDDVEGRCHFRRSCYERNVCFEEMECGRINALEL
jgi:hypothetical protein